MTIIGLDFLEPAAPTLHKVHAAENISDDWIAAFGRHIVGVQILHNGTVKHTARRIYLHTVIKNVNVYLAANFHIVTVDQRIDKGFMYRLFWILRHFHSARTCLFPTLFRIILYKLCPILQEGHK